MTKDSRDLSGASPEFLGAAWFDPIEAVIRDRVRGFIEELVEAELDDALGRSRYQRAEAANVASGSAGYRHGRRARQLLGSFGPVTISVPRARLNEADGTSREWRSEALPRYARMTRQVEALIAGAYLSGTNTRRVRRALGALFKGAVGKDVVSRTWRKVQTDWQAWCHRSLAAEDIVRLILVSCPIDNLTNCRDLPQDFIGCGGPDEWLCAAVVVDDECVDPVDQLSGTRE